ncbi:ER degradation-enhancing alpha-mannosidase-like protein 2 [Macrobrachium rosenbergii]|uniref:ER degradation-enhancing alpha-mannosidase-like protein 2 n=1 Tax=Macrobrachium rosenbergii TaxID=79674 RepID=UPI0034D48E62
MLLRKGNQYLVHIVQFILISSCCGLTEREIVNLREDVRAMFYHAYEGYMTHAYPYDELRPLTCDGHDTWGSYSLTLIDALDTLAVMGNKTEFQRVAALLLEKANFDLDINVSVFETNIRIVGGLLSAHLMSRKMGVELEEGWPCSGPLLRMAKEVANRLLPAFDTPTGMPYGTVNLKEGVPYGETPVTCTAGVGTFIIEFGTLSRLTGDTVYEEVAMRAMHAVWDHRSSINLLGNHIDVTTGRWTAQDSGIGAGIDSYFEYLVKGATLLQRPELMAIFKQARAAADKYLRHDDWYLWATMTKGHVTMAVFQSLEAYWPGVLALIGDINSAMKIIFNYHQVWKQFGFTPEFYNIPQAETSAYREGYPLRPELVESLMYLYRATKDDTLLKMGADIVRSIQHSAKTSCGYATVKNVNDHTLDNRMESFFLAETTKYLYLLFDQENWLHNTGSFGTIMDVKGRSCILEAGGYIFNTEAHPVDPGALACCYLKEEDWSLSLDDQVALIIDPTTPWNDHKGYSSKKDKQEDNSQDCQELVKESEDNSLGENEKGPKEDEEANEKNVNEVENIVTIPQTSETKERGNILFEGMAQDVQVSDDIKEMYHLMKSLGEKSSESRSDEMDGTDSDSQGDEIVTENSPVDGDASDPNTTENLQEFLSPQSDMQHENAIETNDEIPRIIKQDEGPRFSSLSETVERGLGANVSGMEGASIAPSVSSSKYASNSGVPRIVNEPRDSKASKPVKKVFVLRELKERLVTDLSSYRNFTLSISHSLLSCSHPSFSNLLNIKGQMFYP